MKRLRDYFFAGAMLAGDQDVGVRRSNARNRLQNRLHGGCGSDEFGPAFGAQQACFGFQLLGSLQSAIQLDLCAQDCQQALVLPWLLDEVASAAAHSFNRQSHVAPGRHDDDRDAAVEGNDFGEQVETLLAGGGVASVIQVDENSVVKLAGQSFACGRGRLCSIDLKARGTKQQFDGFENVRLVVGRENAAGAPAVMAVTDRIARGTHVRLALRSRQNVLPQRATPSTAAWI